MWFANLPKGRHTGRYIKPCFCWEFMKIAPVNCFRRTQYSSYWTCRTTVFFNLILFRHNGVFKNWLIIQIYFLVNLINTYNKTCTIVKEQSVWHCNLYHYRLCLLHLWQQLPYHTIFKVQKSTVNIIASIWSWDQRKP